jgi:hypothetical protein
MGLLVCAGLTALALAAPAQATPGGIEISIGGAPFTSTPSTSLMTLSNVAPGTTEARVMGVRNTTSVPGSISMKFIGVTSSENGCTAAESAMPGGCDPGGNGQLAQNLTFMVARGTAQGGPFTPVWVGPATDAGTVTVPIDPDLAGGGGTDWVQITAALPVWTGNEVQSDTFGFGLAVVITSIPTPLAVPPTAPSTTSSSVSAPSGSNSVGGVSASRTDADGDSTATVPPPSQGANGQSTGHHSLASTGIDVALLTMIGLLLIFSGALLALKARSARQH